MKPQIDVVRSPIGAGQHTMRCRGAPPARTTIEGEADGADAVTFRRANDYGRNAPFGVHVMVRVQVRGCDSLSLTSQNLRDNFRFQRQCLIPGQTSTRLRGRQQPPASQNRGQSAMSAVKGLPSVTFRCRPILRCKWC